MIEVLAEQNPWWKDRQLINSDYDLVRWRERQYRWVPDLINNIPLEAFALHIITGPRQVGKTTALKLLLLKLLESRHPQSLFYFNCENIVDHRELSEVLSAYFEFREGTGISHSIMLLDEVTSPKEWYRAIKAFIDGGKFQNDVLIITGSASIMVKREVELFPGRRGKGKDFVLHPLSFRGFLKVVDPQLAAKLPHLKDVAALEAPVTNAILYEKELQRYLSLYFTYGGFPLSVVHLHGPTEEAKQVYLSWLKNAILKAERSDVIARQIAKVFTETFQSTISWENVAKKIEIKSPKTVAVYAELFRSIFALTILYNLDVNEKVIRFGKNKKLYVRDPILLEIFEQWCMVTVKQKHAVLAESLVVEHLLRLYPESVFFWKNSFEIDVLILDHGKLYGFEVKWSEAAVARQLPQLTRLVVVTKHTFEKDPLKVPLAVFLSLFDV